MKVSPRSLGIVALATGTLAAGCRPAPAVEDAPPAPAAPAPELVRFQSADGASIAGHLRGAGAHGVVLAHGGRFDKESWREQAEALAEEGLLVLAIDFRGYGDSRPPEDAASGDPTAALEEDVLAAAAFLRGRGAERVSLVGGSLGAWAVGRAAARAEPGSLERVVLLGASHLDAPEDLQGRLLFLQTRDDAWADGQPRLPRIRGYFDLAPEPKRWVVLEGSAHAQWVFESAQGPAALAEITRFLTAP